jgi:hypothetical protein
VDEETDYSQLSDTELDALIALHDKARVKVLPEPEEVHQVIDVKPEE